MKPTGLAPGSQAADAAASLSPSALAVCARHVHKSYGVVQALSGVDLDVAVGEVVAVVGPNGAGKTTLVEILEGHRRRDGGEVQVLGEDPETASRAARARIGIVLQQCEVPPELSVREVVELFAACYPAPLPVDQALALTGLEEQAARRAGRLSGGQQRRLHVAIALVGDPELLFLDEPTTGFDPAARRRAWTVIAGLQALGKTIVLTTHYMEEAQSLADRVVVIDRGAVLAAGSPTELSDRTRLATSVSFRLPAGVSAADLPPLEGLEITDARVHLTSSSPTHALSVLTRWADDRALELPELDVHRPNLEDVYLRLTEEEP